MASSARIDELRKKFEENPRRYFAPLANEYRKAGDIEQAIAICREYLPQQPGHMSGHIVYGQALYEARQVEEARSVFETALSLDPENLIALRHLGDLALMVGDNQGARTWYGRVLEADPRNEEIQAQLAKIDQAPSLSPTPIATAAQAPTPLNSPAIPSAPTTPPPPEAAAPKSTPASSAPTVVISPQRPPEKQTPTPSPSVNPTPQGVPTLEVHLDAVLPPAPPSQEPPPVEKAAGLETTTLPQSQSADVPPIQSFSLEGLETTSMSPPAGQESVASAPPPEPAPAAPASDLGFGALAESPPPPAIGSTPAPVDESPAAPVDKSPPTPVDESPPAPAAELPMLDLSEPAVPPQAALPQPEQVAQPSEPVSAQAEPVVDMPLLDLNEASPPLPPESGPFVTETMAELYLHQGHRDEALRVYRALLDQRPDDATLRAKVAELSPAPAPSDGPTIRELLAAIAVRRPSRPQPASDNGAPAVVPVVDDGAAVDHETAAVNLERPAAEPAAQPVVDSRPAANDALAILLGDVKITQEDETAATNLARAFADLNGLENGASATPTISGAPARAASNDLSLDSVFKSGDTAAQPAAPSSFSFDQFFSARATSEHPTPRGSGAVSGTQSRDDVAQFTQWLEGLKRK
jgi:tetratricopeptide (TPR) repeat protein